MADKKFIVSHVKPDNDVKGINVDGKFMEFSKSGESFYVSDPGVAKAIDQSVGSKGSKDVRVTEVAQMKKEGVHNYFFTVKKPELKKEKDSKYTWVETSPGIYKMVKKEA